MRFLRLLWLAVMLSGCIPYSDNPLTAPDNEDPDPAIRGTWFFYEDGETVFLHIGIDEKTKQLRLVMVEFQKDHEVKTSELVGHISRLKNNTYLNLRWDRSEDQGLGYLFVKYQIAEERLGLGLIRSDPVETAIREGKIQGQIKQNPSSVRLTDSSEKLQGYVQEHDRIVFEELKWMNRWIPSQNPVGAFIGQNGEDIILKKRQDSRKPFTPSEISRVRST